MAEKFVLLDARAHVMFDLAFLIVLYFELFGSKAYFYFFGSFFIPIVT